jgi:hypothetical protein
MEDSYFPIEKPGQKKDFASSHVKFKDSKGKVKKLGEDDNDPQAFFTKLRSKEAKEDRYSRALKDLKVKSSKNMDILNKLNKIREKDE